VVLTRDEAITSGYQTSGLGADILEKPETREENLRMLMELNGRSCEVVTGVTVCKSLSLPFRISCLHRPSIPNHNRSWLQDTVSVEVLTTFLWPKDGSLGLSMNARLYTFLITTRKRFRLMLRAGRGWIELEGLQFR
jgi:Maf-like protein